MTLTPEQLHAAMHASDKARCKIMRGLIDLVKHLPVANSEISAEEITEIKTKVCDWHQKLKDAHQRLLSETH